MIIVRGSVLFSLAAHGLLYLIGFAVNCYRILGIEGSSCSPFVILVDFIVLCHFQNCYFGLWIFTLKFGECLLGKS